MNGYILVATVLSLTSVIVWDQWGVRMPISTRSERAYGFLLAYGALYITIHTALAGVVYGGWCLLLLPVSALTGWTFWQLIDALLMTSPRLNNRLTKVTD